MRVIQQLIETKRMMGNMIQVKKKARKEQIYIEQVKVIQERIVTKQVKGYTAQVWMMLQIKTVQTEVVRAIDGF